jgi:phosphatidylinositol kinase/protein kinase (PI-3  family)
VEANQWCKKYGRSGNLNDVNQAWDLYYHVFRKINKQLPQLTSLELQYVSPRLLAARDLDLVVPGVYIVVTHFGFLSSTGTLRIQRDLALKFLFFWIRIQLNLR